eukprot:scaffold1502_cov229-Pinguiococcus_pyrenoidosus.AAC.5
MQLCQFCRLCKLASATGRTSRRCFVRFALPDTFQAHVTRGSSARAAGSLGKLLRGEAATTQRPLRRVRTRTLASSSFAAVPHSRPGTRTVPRGPRAAAAKIADAGASPLLSRPEALP